MQHRNKARSGGWSRQVNQHHTYIDVNANEETLDMPSNLKYLVIIPESTTPVMEFCRAKLPSRQNAPITMPIEAYFKQKPPTTELRKITSRPLPPSQFVTRAKTYVRQAIEEGSQSICSPLYPLDPLPLWALDYWSQMGETIDRQEEWKSAKKWLERHSDESATGVVVQRSLLLLDHIGWREKLKGRAGGDTSTLASILSFQMTKGIVLDLMMAEVQTRIEASRDLSEIYEAVTLDFLSFVGTQWRMALRKARGTPSSHLVDLKNRMKLKPKILLVPAHLEKDSHYIGVRIDFRERTISYGDSLLRASTLHRALPQEVKKPLQWWLSREFDGPFEELGAILERHKQNDGHSCAFTTVNMLCWEILQQPMWHPHRRVYDRADWFLKLVKRHVSNTSSNTPKLDTMEATSKISQLLA